MTRLYANMFFAQGEDALDLLVALELFGAQAVVRGLLAAGCEPGLVQERPWHTDRDEHHLVVFGTGDRRRQFIVSCRHHLGCVGVEEVLTSPQCERNTVNLTTTETQ